MITEEERSQAKEMLSFIGRSPSCFHAVKNISNVLVQHGFNEISEETGWNLEKGKSYFVKRNNSSLIAFTVPEDEFKRFLISSCHSDSPSFKIKENPEIEGSGCVRLNIEKYGGMLCAPWFDRPLSVAGRLLLKSDSPFSLEEKLVCVDRDLLVIPSLAIHMNRDANSEKKYNVQNDMLPVLSAGEEKTGLVDLVCRECNVDKSEVVGADLFLYNRDKGTFLGSDGEMIGSPRLDDLECAYTTLQGFIDSENNQSIIMYCIFDNEEVGSLSRQGADSTFLEDVLKRICLSLGMSQEDYYTLVAGSFMVSADNGHAEHPNFSSSADPVNKPRLNAGPVIKFNASQKYTTDGISSGMFTQVCKKAGVPVQTYTNRSDIQGGSTLGNISNAHVSLKTVDVGLPQWAMHSPYETAGSRDVSLMIRAMKSFFETV